MQFQFNSDSSVMGTDDVAERIEADRPAAVRLRWNALAADAVLTAFPGPPVLASFDASS